MINPVTELRAFVRAALVDPVPRDHTEPDGAFRRRRVVAVVTLVVGRRRARLGAAHRARRPRCSTSPRSRWPASGRSARSLSGPLHLGRARTRAGSTAAGPSCSRWRSACCCWRVFMAGAVVVAQVPFLRDPVEELLDHARSGSLAAGRGDHGRQRRSPRSSTSVGRSTPASAAGTPSWSPPSSTPLVTAASGIPLLVLAARPRSAWSSGCSAG